MNTDYVRALDQKSKRVIRAIMLVKERECDPHLPAEASFLLREAILNGINDLHDLAQLVARSAPEYEVNQLILDRFDQLEGLIKGVADA